MARRDGMDLPEDASWTKDMAKAEKVMDAGLVHVERIIGDFAKCRDLGPERQSAMLLRDKERLYPEWIAREAKAPRFRVPYGGGIHPLGAKPRVITPSHEAGEEGLDVAMGLECVRAANLAAKIEMVHDLAIADNSEPAVRAEDRLVSAGEIDDAEAPHSKAEITIDVDALVIRAAVDEWTALGRDKALFDWAAAPPVPASDSAHAFRNCPSARGVPRRCEALRIGN
jgi:hypothetical protein